MTTEIVLILLQLIARSILIGMLTWLWILAIKADRKSARKRTKYTYFVSYSFLRNGTIGVSASEMVFNKPITGLEQIKHIQRLIQEEQDKDTVVITNYILLREE